MTADREPNRLPLRAGAMLLLAIAIVCIGLGWHSAATSGKDPDAGLEAAQSAQPSTTAAAPSSSASAAGSSTTQVCVINAGSVTGLAAKVTDVLKKDGFRTALPKNYTGGKFTENTVYYDDDSQKAQAQKVNQALGGDASVEHRPATFTECSDGLPVVVVTR